GNFRQEGGVTIVTNVDFFGGTVALTNATLIFSNATQSSSNSFIENGGTVSGSNFFASGSIELHAGKLFWLTLNTGNFIQYGGEVDASSFGSGNYWLSNGVLNAGSLSDFLGSFTQTGGRTTVTNSIFVAGLLEAYGPPFIGSYVMQGVFLSS